MGNNVPQTVPVFQADRGVTLLGGGRLMPDDLSMSLAVAPHLVAADSGAMAALAAGHMPEAVYGDMDSLPAAIRAQIPRDRIHQIAEQTSTDFDKALRHIAAPVILAAGFTGGRVDHELAVYHGLVARPDARCLVVGAQDIVMHAPPRLALDLPVGTRLSLFPMASVTGVSRGLAWPIAGLVFHPAQRIGTSNVTDDARLELSFDAPGMLLIVPRVHLGVMAAALAATSVWSRMGGKPSV